MLLLKGEIVCGYDLLCGKSVRGVCSSVVCEECVALLKISVIVSKIGVATQYHCARVSKKCSGAQGEG